MTLVQTVKSQIDYYFASVSRSVRYRPKPVYFILLLIIRGDNIVIIITIIYYTITILHYNYKHKLHIKFSVWVKQLFPNWLLKR